MEYIVLFLSFILGACWRRIFGGWRPFGIHLPRIVNLVIYAIGACLTAACFLWPSDWQIFLSTIALAFSWTPAHGTDSNMWHSFNNDWIEQALRYGIFPGILVGAFFVWHGSILSAIIMLISGILAGLAAAFFVIHGEEVKWLPVDPTPHSFADGRKVYNEFSLGGIISFGFCLACLLAI